MLLQHSHTGVDLQINYAVETVKHIHKLWGKNIYLKTIVNKEPVVIWCIEVINVGGLPLYKIEVVKEESLKGTPTQIPTQP